MADRIEFELVSPERLVLARAVEMVVLPGVEGDFGALPEHAPTVAQLRPGVIAVFDNGQVTDRIFVGGKRWQLLRNGEMFCPDRLDGLHICLHCRHVAPLLRRSMRQSQTGMILYNSTVTILVTALGAAT